MRPAAVGGVGQGFSACACCCRRRGYQQLLLRRGRRQLLLRRRRRHDCLQLQAFRGGGCGRRQQLLLRGRRQLLLRGGSAGQNELKVNALGCRRHVQQRHLLLQLQQALLRHRKLLQAARAAEEGSQQ